ncbi:hypothetical protein QVD17_39468 [Tagetes erecta]|uniref:Uncharacterized protein n=1 Tax=Tagetes erecta TaxID=13708 RepID=A0AAD8JQH1_TARER|nr:hypothetical protein QVD17_39468 [Tagetes erecta]
MECGGEEHTENIQEETNVIDMPDTDVADAESSQDEEAGSKDVSNPMASFEDRAGALLNIFQTKIETELKKKTSPESIEWRKTLHRPIGSYKREFIKRIMLRIRSKTKIENKKILKAIVFMFDVEFVSIDSGILLVVGHHEDLDPIEVIERMRKIGIMAEIIYIA